MQSTLEKSPIADSLTHAMQVCADVAKLYRKHGTPRNYHLATTTKKGEPYPHTPEVNIQAHRRRFRLAPKPVGARACGRCGLLFVAPTAQRCQCKAV